MTTSRRAGVLAAGGCLLLLPPLVVGSPRLGPLQLQAPAPPDRVTLAPVARGLSAPVHVTNAGDGSGRLFVVEQEGRIKIIEKEGGLRAAPFLDIVPRVRSGGEMGLLSVAFHPRYRDDGRFYVNYTRRPPGARRGLETVVSEWRASKDSNTADPASERVLLTISQPYPNHNGGHILFGPDGFLYIGMGDGGLANDPQGHGQNLESLLGKVLRIDVEPPSDPKSLKPYGVPPDNPFVGKPGAAPEIWAWGMRNPWRMAFDPERPGKLFAADVGQNTWEEIHLLSKGDNGGWNLMEGLHPFAAPKDLDRSKLNLPIHEYPRSDGVSITGGPVYRGKGCPSLVGTYLFADYEPGPIWGLVEKDGAWQRVVLVARRREKVSSFGEDEAGEVYVVFHDAGTVVKITEGAAAGPF